MATLNWKNDLKTLYFPPARPVMVDVPAMNFLMIDGHGDPNNNPHYQAVVEALFGLSYTLKFAIKKAGGADYAVFPLEGLWWVPDMADFSVERKQDWDWTMMMAQPEPVTPEGVERARAEVVKKKGPALEALVSRARFERYHEGLCAQVMHTGPYSAEGPTIAGLHDFIAAQGCARSGKHHEIYLSDVRRTAPEKLKTAIRQPAARLP
jgi:hypothetical protein